MTRPLFVLAICLGSASSSDISFAVQLELATLVAAETRILTCMWYTEYNSRRKWGKGTEGLEMRQKEQKDQKGQREHKWGFLGDKYKSGHDPPSRTPTRGTVIPPWTCHVVGQKKL